MFKLKEHLECNDKNDKYIQSLRKVYLVGCWAKYGVLEFPYTGKMVDDNEFGLIPLVYDFDDHNGTYNEYVLRKLNEVTTGQIITYTFNEHIANSIAEQYNELYSYKKQKETYPIQEDLDICSLNCRTMQLEILGYIVYNKTSNYYLGQNILGNNFYFYCNEEEKKYNKKIAPKIFYDTQGAMKALKYDSKHHEKDEYEIKQVSLHYTIKE